MGVARERRRPEEERSEAIVESQTLQVDLYKYDPAFAADPYPVYTRMRETSPIHRVTLPDGRGAWLVTRYEDAAAVLRDKRFVKNWRNALGAEEVARVPPVPEAVKLVKENMLYADPPDHARLRRLVSGAFTPDLADRMRPRVQEIANELLDAVKDKGRMDLCKHYAFPLPTIVIAEMLGLPAKDRDKFRDWTDAAASGDGTREYLEKITPDMRDFAEYLRAVFERKREDPKDDLMSALARAGEPGDRLSEDELLGMAVALLVGGHENTANIIATGTLALLRHPEQFERLRTEPSLIDAAVEELLRYENPVEKATERFAREDVAIGGTVIPKGEMVLVVLAAANRDPQRFPDPEELDVARADNKHLAFGKGIHHCLGAPLARVEARIAIGTLLRRMPNLRLTVSPESLIWRPGLLFRSLRSLPVEF